MNAFISVTRQYSHLSKSIAVGILGGRAYKKIMIMINRSATNSVAIVGRLKQLPFFILLLLALYSSDNAAAQKANRPLSTRLNNIEPSSNPPDTAYLRKTPRKFVFVLKNANWMDTYRLRVSDVATVGIKSDLCYNLSFAIGYRYLLLSYSANLNSLGHNKSISRNEWEVNLTSRMLSIEVSHLSNQGQSNIYRLKHNNAKLNLDKTFNGLSAEIYAVDVNYYFNHKRYSNSAAYKDSHRYNQIQSAGSFIAGFSLTSNYLFFDLFELADDSQLNVLKELGPLKNNYNAYRLSFGYGYNYAFSSRWLINLTVIPSAGIRIDKDLNMQQEYFTFKNRVKMALVNDLPRYFWGINCQYNTNWSLSSNYSVANSIGKFNLLIGVRF